MYLHHLVSILPPVETFIASTHVIGFCGRGRWKLTVQLRGRDFRSEVFYQGSRRGLSKVR